MKLHFVWQREEVKTTMYKTEHIRRVATQTRLSQRVVADVIAASHRLIEETLRTGGTVTFPGFGRFSVTKRKATRVRHIQTRKEKIGRAHV